MFVIKKGTLKLREVGTSHHLWRHFFILAAVNYYKTPFCFHDMRCDLLKLFINPTILFHLVLKHFYLRLPWAAVYYDGSYTRKGKIKECCQEKVRRNGVSEKRKPRVKSGILQEDFVENILFDTRHFFPSLSLFVCLFVCLFVYF
jgi:hypothetical protein